jgi:sarcosine oxidase
VRTGERVLAIEDVGHCVRVRTERRMLEATRVIVTAGAWTASLLPELPLPLQATRQVLLWIRPTQPELFRAGWFPVFLIESEDGIHYGFPLHGDDLLKVAKHHHCGEPADPENYQRQVTEADEALILGPLRRMLPAAAGPVAMSKTCLYTMAPDGDFVIDRVPGRPNIVVASPCSGHGFKFAPAIGQALVELAFGGRTGLDLSRFRVGRFMRPLSAPGAAQ